MASMLRKLKKARKPSSPDFKTEEDFNKGFHAGAKEQRKSDIESVVKMLKGLEEIPGIGEKTAWKIRELFLKQFEGSER